MSKPKYADPRDGNERALLKVAERLGAHWHKGPPLDGWIFVRGKFVPVEIKRDEREGQAWEYTPAQKRFMTWCRNRGATWWVWRTEADVLRDLGGKVSAGVPTSNQITLCGHAHPQAPHLTCTLPKDHPDMHTSGTGVLWNMAR